MGPVSPAPTNYRSTLSRAVVRSLKRLAVIIETRNRAAHRAACTTTCWAQGTCSLSLGYNGSTMLCGTADIEKCNSMVAGLSLPSDVICCDVHYYSGCVGINGEQHKREITRSLGGSSYSHWYVRVKVGGWLVHAACKSQDIISDHIWKGSNRIQETSVNPGKCFLLWEDEVQHESQRKREVIRNTTLSTFCCHVCCQTHQRRAFEPRLRAD